MSAPPTPADLARQLAAERPELRAMPSTIAAILRRDHGLTASRQAIVAALRSSGRRGRPPATAEPSAPAVGLVRVALDVPSAVVAKARKSARRRQTTMERVLAGWLAER